MVDKERFVASHKYWIEMMMQEACSAWGACTLQEVTITYVEDIDDSDSTHNFY